MLRKMCVALIGLAVACSDPTVPPPAGAEFSFASDSIEISAPGEGRVQLNIVDTAADPGIETTGPLSASIETSGGVVKKRVIVVDASAAGTGYVRLTNMGRADSLKVVATVVSFKRIAVTYGHACGIAADDRAWCWGANNSDQIGANTSSACLGGACQYHNGGSAKLPLPVEGNHKFASIAVAGKSCSLDFSIGACGKSCAITAQGQTYCWGLLHERPPVAYFTDRTMASTVSALSTSSSYYTMQATPCGLNTQGEAYCVASTGSSRVGGTLIFTSFGTASSHSCGVSGGDVYCWGSNAAGQLGIGSADGQQHTTPEKAAASVAFTAVAVGDTQTCALGVDHKVYCWGRGITAPTALAGTGSYESFSLDLTSPSVCGLSSAGSVDCWPGFASQPSAVQAATPFIAVSVGGLSSTAAAAAQSCGLAASGDVYCWRGTFIARKLGDP
jgi:hypothetical protein